jgi:metallo-beta-lactamase family protein
MKITFHGATETVTGSQHLIEVNGKKIMLGDWPTPYRQSWA